MKCEIGSTNRLFLAGGENGRWTFSRSSFSPISHFVQVLFFVQLIFSFSVRYKMIQNWFVFFLIARCHFDGSAAAQCVLSLRLRSALSHSLCLSLRSVSLRIWIFFHLIWFDFTRHYHNIPLNIVYSLRRFRMAYSRSYGIEASPPRRPPPWPRSSSSASGANATRCCGGRRTRAPTPAPRWSRNCR